MSRLGAVYGAVRNNWRVVLLVLLVFLSTYFLFVPGATLGGDSAGGDADTGVDRLTNLQFGIDLAGGSRIISPIEGVWADEIGFEATEGEELAEEADALADAVAEELNVSEPNIRVDAAQATLEIFDPSITQDDLANALAATDTDYGSLHDGVTADTREDIVTVLENRLDAAGFAGASVAQQTLADGSQYIRAEWPGSLENLRAAMSERGLVQVVAHAGEGGNWSEQVVLDSQEDIASIEAPRQPEQLWEVPVTVTEDHAPTFVQRLQELGFDQSSGWSSCNWNDADEQQERGVDDWGHCLMIVQDGEILNAYGVSPNLGEDFEGESPAFLENPTFVIQTEDRAEADDVRFNLQEGSLSAELDLDDATEMEVSPALAEQFLRNSMLTGLVAIIAVVVMVFLRYGDPRVAAPMSVTALSELYLLLGFASAIGMSLDLAVMAGFIAVVGTGVDDLVIIADEVMGKHDVRSQRVFDSRFRKAFWVIGTAAATTIVAMSPLAFMQLGDLRGFAIVTILGVLIGVFLSRPAYGNILRLLKTDT